MLRYHFIREQCESSWTVLHCFTCLYVFRITDLVNIDEIGRGGFATVFTGWIPMWWREGRGEKVPSEWRWRRNEETGIKGGQTVEQSYPPEHSEIQGNLQWSLRPPPRVHACSLILNRLISIWMRTVSPNSFVILTKLIAKTSAKLCFTKQPVMSLLAYSTYTRKVLRIET